MPHVAALYRYPVKGFTAETCGSLTVLDEGRIAGDRVLGVRFADTSAADDTWGRKSGMLVLMNTPGLARLCVKFDEKESRLQVSSETSVLADEALTPEGRQRIGAALARYALELAENPLTGHPERLPLRVIGDGRSPRYHDEEPGRVTLHGRGSLEALQAAVGGDVSEIRFRSNIAVDGLAAWDELDWVGRGVRIGVVEFDVVSPKTRCLATHANPVTGERDIDMLSTLTHEFGQEFPTFGVAMQPRGAGGKIRVGDRVTVLD